jgi:Xaa-Pro aminopeptidase
MEPSFDFEARLQRVQAFLDESGINAMILLNTRNIYWLTGSAQASHLIIARGKDPVLMVKRNIDLARAHSWFPADWIRPLGSTKDAIACATELVGDAGTRIGMELNGLPASHYLNYVKGFDGFTIENVSEPLRNLRAIKDAGEIAKVEQAARVAGMTQDVVYAMVQESFTPGTTERDVAAEMIHVAKKNRSEHYSIYDNNMFTNFNNFFIVASGESLWTPSTFPIMSGAGFSPAIPFGQSDRELHPGDILVCDYAVVVDGYHGDHARTYVVDGQWPEFFKERYGNLKLAFDRTVDSIEPGQKSSDIYAMMEGELARIGDPDPDVHIENYFEGNGTYYQGFGHGIGLELDEPPFITKVGDVTIDTNMAISLEPKILIPGWGAVNLEDDFIIEAGVKARKVTPTRYLEF